MHLHACLFAVAFVAPQALFLGYLGDSNALLNLCSRVIHGLLTPIPQVEWWAYAILAAFSLERLLYVYVWLNPVVWMKFCEQMPKEWGNPWTILGKTLPLNKCIQTLSLLLVHFCIHGFQLPRTATGVLDAYAIFTALQLLLIGQALNWSVYFTIGKAGVYYGCRLGAKVPWVSGPPFTLCRHPQYIGAMLSLLGVGLLGITDWHSQHGMWLAVFGCFALYGVTMYVEDRL
eukprot:EG_transcript_22198